MIFIKFFFLIEYGNQLQERIFPSTSDLEGRKSEES
jgi:hypothetical protein